MKLKKSFLQLLCLLFALHVCGQGTFVYDQQSSDENNYQEGGVDVQQGQPVGQSFTPSLSTVGFIRLFMNNGVFGNISQATVLMNLRSNSVTGPILDTSRSVVIPGGVGFSGTVDFIFNAPIAVQPETSYYFEPVILDNNNLWANASYSYNYPGGGLFVIGLPHPNRDLWFREGIIVPEPSSVVLLFAGACVAIWCACRKRKNCACIST